MIEALETFGNPSSLHDEGRRARQLVEEARDRVAQLVGARREEIVFTSGGTEANNLAVRGLARGRRVVLSPIEHPSVHADGAELLRVDADGRVDLEDLARKVSADTLVSVQLANHEIGVVQDLAAIAAIAHRAGAIVHTDAVQAAGKLAFDVRALGVDALSLSAHKLGGPKGVGALWLRDGLDLAAMIGGGHQERGRRPGTENALGIVGFGAAAAAVELPTPALRDRFEAGAVALGARVPGSGAARVPTTSYVVFDGVEGELLMQALDLEGVAVSTGAACSSGSIEPSPVLRALGYAEGIRVSLGRDSRAADVDRVLALLPSLIARIKRA
ncbi:MAG: iscS [Myxococcales bacterium]|nr:iscS [Myxococcales bacterium]